MKPQSISTAPAGARLLGWFPALEVWAPFDVSDAVGKVVSHWLPMPEPPPKKQAYYILEVGEHVKEGDEYYRSLDGSWVPVVPYMVGLSVMGYHHPHRRAIPNPES